jgi:hypothetical protein
MYRLIASCIVLAFCSVPSLAQDRAAQEYQVAVYAQQYNQQCAFLNIVQDAALTMNIKAMNKRDPDNLYKIEEGYRKQVLNIGCTDPNLKTIVAQGRQLAEFNVLRALVIAQAIAVDRPAFINKEALAVIDEHVSTSTAQLNQSEQGKTMLAQMKDQAKNVAWRISPKNEDAKKQQGTVNYALNSGHEADKIADFVYIFVQHKKHQQSKLIARYSNDNTGWTAWRGLSTERINWLISNKNCQFKSYRSSSRDQTHFCTLFISPEGRVGIVIDSEYVNPLTVELAMRDSDKMAEPTKEIFGFAFGKPWVLGAYGDHYDGEDKTGVSTFTHDVSTDFYSENAPNLEDAKVFLAEKIAVSNVMVPGTLPSQQTGYEVFPNKHVFMFPADTWSHWQKLKPNDVLLMRVHFERDGRGKEIYTRGGYVKIPNQGLNRAVNWVSAQSPG